MAVRGFRPLRRFSSGAISPLMTRIGPGAKPQPSWIFQSVTSREDWKPTRSLYSSSMPTQPRPMPFQEQYMIPSWTITVSGVEPSPWPFLSSKPLAFMPATPSSSVTYHSTE